MTFGTARVERADARALPLPDASVDLIVTSPPYWALRDYKDGGQSLDGQIGAEATPAEYIAALLDCTREWARVLKSTGSLWVNLGDKYAGSPSGPRESLDRAGAHVEIWRSRRHGRRSDVPNKSLIGLPWRYAIGCIDDLGLILRAETIWSKPNGVPESVTDRVRRAHENWFHFTKEPRYYAAVDDIREPHISHQVRGTEQAIAMARRREAGATPNPRGGTFASINPVGKLPGSVWHIATQPLTIPPRVSHSQCCQGTDSECDKGLSHFAAFPTKLIRPIILGWSPSGICLECGEGRRPLAEAYDTDAPRPGREGARIIGSTCGCPHATAPTRNALVIDPFGGTGTTAMVARALGRDSISFDLSAGYLGLAEWRINDRRELCIARGRYRPPAPADPLRAAALDMLARMAGV